MVNKKERKLDNINKSQSVKIELEFPDTVIVNKLYEGNLYFQTALDSLTTKFNDKEKIRYVRFAMLTTDRPDYSDNVLKRKVTDTFGAINNRQIPIYDISFKNVGTNYIEGYINDIVLKDTLTKYNPSSEEVRLIENNYRVTKKVIVVEDK